MSRIRGLTPPQKRRPRRPRRGGRATRGGFTLVELLIVVAIVALLLSILSPSLQRAIELTRRALCAMNEKSMGLGFHMYANAFNDITPPILIDMRWFDHEKGWWRKYWADFIVGYFDDGAKAPTWGYHSVGEQPARGNEAAFRENYGVTPSRMFDCPSQPNEDTWEYCMNYSSAWGGAWCDNGGYQASTVTRMQDYTLPKYCVVLEPAFNFYLMNEWYQPSRTLRFANNTVHLGSSNGLMYDGHVELFDRKRIEDWYYLTNHQQLPFYQPGLGPYCP